MKSTLGGSWSVLNVRTSAWRAGFDFALMCTENTSQPMAENARPIDPVPETNSSSTGICIIGAGQSRTSTPAADIFTSSS